MRRCLHLFPRKITDKRELHRPREWGACWLGLYAWNRWNWIPLGGSVYRQAGRDFSLVTIFIPKPQEPVNENTFRFRLGRKRLRPAYRREGHYLIRSISSTRFRELISYDFENLSLLLAIFVKQQGNSDELPCCLLFSKRCQKAVLGLSFIVCQSRAYFFSSIFCFISSFFSSFFFSSFFS